MKRSGPWNDYRLYEICGWQKFTAAIRLMKGSPNPVDSDNRVLEIFVVQVKPKKQESFKEEWCDARRAEEICETLSRQTSGCFSLHQNVRHQSGTQNHGRWSWKKNDPMHGGTGEIWETLSRLTSKFAIGQGNLGREMLIQRYRNLWNLTMGGSGRKWWETLIRATSKGEKKGHLKTGWRNDEGWVS